MRGAALGFGAATRLPYAGRQRNTLEIREPYRRRWKDDGNLVGMAIREII